MVIVPQVLEDYAASHSDVQSPLRAELAAHTRVHCTYPDMMVGPLEGALLQMLIRLTGARRVLEIGLFTGYSALAMAEALPADGRIVSCEIDARNAEIAKDFFARSADGGKIDIRLGPALDTLQDLPEDTLFDFAFIDADKENYGAYYDLILPRLRPGGLLVADNVLWSGRVLSPRTESDHGLVQFSDKVQQDERVENVMLTVRDGVMLVRKK